MILLGKLFIFFVEKIILSTQVVVLNDIVTKAFYFLFTSKVSCMSQIVVLDDIVRSSFYFLCTRNYTVYLTFRCYMIFLGKLFIFFAQGKSTVSPWLRC